MMYSVLVKKYCTYLLLIPVLFSCNKSNEQGGVFRLIPSEESGIDFKNEIKNTEKFNIFNYRNFYNGGGVAVGDINNDGLADVYFTANMGSNKLYLNKGNFEFEDITQKAGIAELEKWSTGVVMVDINNDKLLDIYVCNAGYQKGVGQENALFINNGDLTFTEKAAEYGLDDNGYTTHAAFLDYDLDGDLDVYLLNNSFIPVNTLNYANNREMRAKDWPVKDFLKGGGDKLLKNENGKFIDISEQAGIYGSLIGFGLGVTIGDINQDNYPDIYVSNDFFEKDYLYINQKDGTFIEDLENKIGHTSLASMGADMADINNDGEVEIFVTDMLPATDERLKTTSSFENHYIFDLKQKKGFYNQYMQNTLQLNNGDGTFSEIANYAGVNASDWSWGALMFDADNDRKTDIYVCNGILHDVIDQDFIDFFANEISQKMAISGKKESIQSILDHMPSKPQINAFFHNTSNLKFEEASQAFGFKESSFSNGAAYADLDNDGDLDLIVNNVNSEAFLYQNNINSKNHYIKIKIEGDSLNTFAIGSKIKVFSKGEIISRQLVPSRGFQSSTEYTLTIGLGDSPIIDSIHFITPKGLYQELKNIKADTTLNLKVTNAINAYSNQQKIPNNLYFTSQTANFQKHTENEFEDYFNERNIPLKLSKEGPAMAIGDLNKDGTDDVFLGGAKGQIAKIYLQKNGTIVETKQSILEKFIDFEDTAADFFDADNDGDLDLLIGSGGNEYDAGIPLLTDRLMLNDGNGQFTFAPNALPRNGFNTSTITHADYDADGDLDVFIGSRSVPKSYGSNPVSYLLENQGNGTFKDVTGKKARTLQKIGMVRAAQFADLDNDKTPELIVSGDWMYTHIFKYSQGEFKEMKSGLEKYSGFWGSIKLVDVDNDRDLDLVAGNIGENFALKVNPENPLKLWLNDFDKNGVPDKVLTKTINQRDVPVFLKRELTEQFPGLKTENLKHAEYSKNDIYDLFSESILKNSQVKNVNYLKSILAINNGKGLFTIKQLPYQVDFSCVNAIAHTDANKDGKIDLLLGGNFEQMIPQLNALDACKGTLLINKGNNQFEYMPAARSGFNINKGETKGILPINSGKKNGFMVAINNQTPKLFYLNK